MMKKRLMNGLSGARFAKPLFSICLLGAISPMAGAVQVTESSPVYVAPIDNGDSVQNAPVQNAGELQSRSGGSQVVVDNSSDYVSNVSGAVASQVEVDDVEDFGIIPEDTAPANPLADDRELLVQELQGLRLQVELQAKQIQDLKKSNKSLYEDLDRRLQALTKKVVELKSVPAQTASSGPLEGDGTGADSQSLTNTAESLDAESQPLVSNVANSETDKTRYLKAKALLDRGGQDTRAAAEFLTILKDYPNTLLKPNIYYWLAQTYKRRSEFEKAERYYNRVLSEYPGSLKAASSLGSLANLKETQGKLDVAKSLWGKLLREYPNSSEAVTAKQRLAP
jgi:TolA-binding protein